MNRCQARYAAGDLQGVIRLCDQAIQKNPEDPVPHDVRAQVHTKLKQYDRAMEDENHALSLAQRKKLPGLIASYLYGRAKLQSRLRAYPAALRDLQEAAKLYPESRIVRNDLAWLRATAPDPAVRSGRDAVAQARLAVALSRAGHTWGVLDTLAAAYAEGGDFALAVKTERQALAAAPGEIKDKAGLDDRLRKARDRLRLFEQHQPYHEDTFTD